MQATNYGPTAGESAPIVVFGYKSLGDAVSCHSLIQLIAQRNPGRPIDMVLPAKTVGITDFMPEVRAGIVETFRAHHSDLAGRLRLAKHLRGRKYAAAYIVDSTFRSALIPFLARIPERIGWSREWRRPLLTKPRIGERRFWRLVDRICWLFFDAEADAPANWPAPRLTIPAALRCQFDALALKARSMAPVVVMAPGSGSGDKDWPVEHFAAVARHCVDAGCAVWIVGSDAQRPLAQQIGASAAVHDFMTHSLAELVLTIAAADIYVGNDTGPLHIAAGFGKPCLAIYGHRDFTRYGPIRSGVHIVMPELSRPQRFRKERQWPSPERVIFHLDRLIAAAKRKGEAAQVSTLADAEPDGGAAPKQGDVTISA